MDDLSEYERARLLQIEKNKALLASLNISELTSTMVAPKRGRPVSEKKRKFTEEAAQPPVIRRSARVAGMPASTIPDSTETVATESAEDKRRIRRDGDFSMESACTTDTQATHEHIFKSLKDITFVTTNQPPKTPEPNAKAKKQRTTEVTPKRVSPRRKAQNAEEDKENIENVDTQSKKESKQEQQEKAPAYVLKTFATATMQRLDMSSYSKLQVTAVTKSVPDRIYSLAFHPSNDRIVLTTGDSWGRIGIWNYGTLTAQENEHDLCIYKPHCAPVTGLLFSPSDSSKLFSSSYDGTIRCADINKGEFSQIHLKDGSRTSFDVSPTSSNIIYAGSGDGILTFLDTRSPKVVDHEVHTKKIHSVSINPSNNNTVATGSTDQTLCIWDVRKMKNPVHCFKHPQAVTSCGFSKRTGKYLVSFSYDNHIRIWDNLKATAVIDHNTTTGRWITPFKVAWDPKADNIFACGNMKRSLDIFDAETHLTKTQLADEEVLTAIPSVNAFHQYHNVMASGTASGRTYVWIPSAL